VSEALEIFFYNSTVLARPNTLSRLVASFEDAGFNVQHFQVGEAEWTWNASDTGRAEALQTAWTCKGCMFSAYNQAFRLQILQQLYWDVENLGGVGQCYICTSTDNTPYFWRPEYDPPRYSDLYLALAERLYNLLHPTFGWVDFHSDWLTSHQNVQNLELPALYWATFLGPPYVAKLGRDHITQAPVGKTKPLNDGGILYVLSSGPGLAEDSLQSEQIAAIQSHFHVERFR